MRLSVCLRNKAFTLIELLVTIMIIMVLAGLILPVIKNVKRKGREALCRKNLKELQVAAISYSVNSGGDFPCSDSTEKYYYNISPCDHGSGNTWCKEATGWVDWFNYSYHHNSGNASARLPGESRWWGGWGLNCITNGTLWYFVGQNTKVYGCPEFQRKDVCGAKDPLGGNLTFDTTNNYPWRSYAMNTALSGASLADFEASKYILFAEISNTNYYKGVRMAEVNMGEADASPWARWNGTLTCTNIPASRTYPYENIGLYHNGKGNVVFADGHVEQLTWQVTTNAAYGRW